MQGACLAWLYCVTVAQGSIVGLQRPDHFASIYPGRLIMADMGTCLSAMLLPGWSERVPERDLGGIWQGLRHHVCHA
ncbi:hypothetical protein BGZ63DRAFT_120429 [Mariannaea sp. PMI_226]|nr:hypothetical protein BGZ63DRAFT_120429 [Mariannaea sp. PMI_226]